MGLTDKMAATGKAIAEQKQLNDEGLRVVSTLAEEYLSLEEKIEAKQQELKKLVEDFGVVSLNKLPEALADYGLSEVRLASGKKIIVKKFYSARIKPEDRDKAFDWLRSNNFGDLIKREVTVSFGRGEDEVAGKLVTQLTEQNLNLSDETGVHGKTLEAFVKEQKEKEFKNFPDQLFNVFEGSKATIKDK